MTFLRPDKALVFRIVHRDNLAWIAEHGLQPRNTMSIDPGFVAIGDTDLIEKRRTRRVTAEPGGTLGDYVPFYFTPRSIMLNKILTGHGGIPRRDAGEIVVLVSSLVRLTELSIPFLFTDRHASVETARFERDLARLDMIDWRILQASDYRRDSDDPGKVERYQAEALAHGSVPFDALLGIGCHDEHATNEMRERLAGTGIERRVVTREGWYSR